MRTCPECSETKPLEEFHKDPRSAQGRRARCKVCVRTRGWGAGQTVPQRLRLAPGSGCLTKDGYRRVGGIPEHRLVMERILGRQLIAGETVHHKNGIRHDNRPENLELWVSPQPSGQRPADLAAWVVENYPELVLEAQIAIGAEVAS